MSDKEWKNGHKEPTLQWRDVMILEAVSGLLLQLSNGAMIEAFWDLDLPYYRDPSEVDPGSLLWVRNIIQTVAIVERRRRAVADLEADGMDRIFESIIALQNRLSVAHDITEDERALYWDIGRAIGLSDAQCRELAGDPTEESKEERTQ